MFEHLQPEAVTIRIEGLLKNACWTSVQNGDQTDKHEEWTVRIGDSTSTRWDFPYFFYDDIWLVVWNMFCIFHNIWDNPSHWFSYFSRWLKPPTRYGEDPYRSRSSLKGNVLLQGILFDWLDEERAMRKSGSCPTGSSVSGCEIPLEIPPVWMGQRSLLLWWMFHCYVWWTGTREKWRIDIIMLYWVILLSDMIGSIWFWFWHWCFLWTNSLQAAPQHRFHLVFFLARRSSKLILVN